MITARNTPTLLHEFKRGDEVTHEPFTDRPGRPAVVERAYYRGPGRAIDEARYVLRGIGLSVDVTGRSIAESIYHQPRRLFE